MEIRLPDDKLGWLRKLLSEWESRKAEKKRELLSLIGILQRAVRQGLSFLRWLITLSTAMKSLDNYVRLNVPARSDIEGWSACAAKWNGTSMLVHFDRANPEFVVTSNASGNWGWSI